MYQGHLEFLEQEIGTLEEISRIVQLVGESAVSVLGSYFFLCVCVPLPVGVRACN